MASAQLRDRAAATTPRATSLLSQRQAAAAVLIGNARQARCAATPHRTSWRQLFQVTGGSRSTCFLLQLTNARALPHFLVQLGGLPEDVLRHAVEPFLTSAEAMSLHSTNRQARKAAKLAFFKQEMIGYSSGARLVLRGTGADKDTCLPAECLYELSKPYHQRWSVHLSLTSMSSWPMELVQKLLSNTKLLFLKRVTLRESALGCLPDKIEHIELNNCCIIVDVTRNPSVQPDSGGVGNFNFPLSGFAALSSGKMKGIRSLTLENLWFALPRRAGDEETEQKIIMSGGRIAAQAVLNVLENAGATRLNKLNLDKTLARATCLGSAADMSDEQGKAILETISAMQLQHVSLAGFKITDQSIPVLFALVKRSTLKTLNFDWPAHVTDAECTELLRAIFELSAVTITGLKIKKNHLEGVRQAGITHLTLLECQMHSEAFTTLFDAAPMLRVLECDDFFKKICCGDAFKDRCAICHKYVAAGDTCSLSLETVCRKHCEARAISTGRTLNEAECEAHVHPVELPQPRRLRARAADANSLACTVPWPRVAMTSSRSDKNSATKTARDDMIIATAPLVPALYESDTEAVSDHELQVLVLTGGLVTVPMVVWIRKKFPQLCELVLDCAEIPATLLEELVLPQHGSESPRSALRRLSLKSCLQPYLEGDRNSVVIPHNIKERYESPALKQTKIAAQAIVSSALEEMALSLTESNKRRLEEMAITIARATEDPSNSKTFGDVFQFELIEPARRNVDAVYRITRKAQMQLVDSVLRVDKTAAAGSETSDSSVYRIRRRPREETEPQEDSARSAAAATSGTSSSGSSGQRKVRPRFAEQEDAMQTDKDANSMQVEERASVRSPADFEIRDATFAVHIMSFLIKKKAEFIASLPEDERIRTRFVRALGAALDAEADA
jgi:hypothetical protein